MDNVTQKDNYPSFIAVFFAFLLLVFVVESFRLRKDNIKLDAQNKRLKKSKEAYNKVSMGLARINLAERSLEKASIRERKQNLRSFLTELSNAYTLLTGAQCATSIKIPIAVDNKTVFFQTIARDSNVGGRSYNETENTKQYVRKNTALQHIFHNLHSPEGRCFFENNLPLRRGYKDPLFEVYTNISFKGVPSDWNDVDRISKWKLPYKSTILVPILPHPDLEEDKQDYMGVLTVDSQETDIFDKMHDVELLISVSDCIYNYMDDFLNFLREEYSKDEKETPNKNIEDEELSRAI